MKALLLIIATVTAAALWWPRPGVFQACWVTIQLVDLLDRLQEEVKAKHAEGQALDQKIAAARATLAELDERIGDHMANLAVKKRLEEIQAAARKFAEELP